MTMTSEMPEVLPKHGILYQEAAAGMALCKPKLMPLKSMTLEKLENVQKEAQNTLKDQDAKEREEERESFQQGMSEMIRHGGGGSSNSTSWQLNRSKDARFDEAPSREASSNSKPDVLSNNGGGM